MTKVRDWMTQHVQSVPPTTPARAAFELMDRQCMRHLLILEEGSEGDTHEEEALRGMLSSRDLARVTLTNSGRVLDMDGCTVAEIMTPSPLVTIGSEASLAEAARLLHEHKVNALPVVDSGLVGLITSEDILRSLWTRP
jgi:CBS domain-containing protein